MRRILHSLVIAVVVATGQPVNASIIEGDQVACDTVTGGGWILGSDSGTSSVAAGAKANFGVGGGVKNGAFWGHLEYNDHSTSPPMQVHGTGVTGYFLGADANERVITGTAEVNGVPGFTYKVEVIDNAEPGRDIDAFSISVDGYAAGFEYGDGPIAGGNIQLHKRNPSNTPPPGNSCP
jgi:hypothetical protein